MLRGIFSNGNDLTLGQVLLADFASPTGLASPAVQATQFLPGGAVPAAKLAHSTESIVAAIFVIVWHVYHVHVERTNLSMFTGRLSEEEMRVFHEKEYERLTPGQATAKAKPGVKQ